MALPKMKTCCACGRRRRAKSFGIKKKRGRDVLRSRCNDCVAEYHRQYRAGSEDVRKRYRASAKRRKKEIKKEVDAIKASTPCADCGKSHPPWRMQFDHPPGVVKVANVSLLVRNVATTKLWEEIKKCELVCANCHADRTHYRRLAVAE